MKKRRGKKRKEEKKKKKKGGGKRDRPAYATLLYFFGIESWNTVS